MKVIRTIAAAAVFAALSALSVSAQQPAATRPAAPAAVPDGKVAIINTEEFGDPKTGIARLVNAYNTVEREFKPRRDEIQTLKTRFDGIVKQISDTQAVAQPASLATLRDQAETLKSEIERKQQDGQRALDKRLRELTDPINQDIGTALQSFAKQRGITIVFDISKMGGVMMIVDGAVDITQAFVADYNQRNPATASAAPAR
ncbi:MAG TPA: OmpH family outer membrane protein [Pyrinomonadaceae bacterium]|nr:OmpH family outer membrane protein [Pyrinomonadaceae bacterium]